MQLCKLTADMPVIRTHTRMNLKVSRQQPGARTANGTALCH